jgi:hypothetical protein
VVGILLAGLGTAAVVMLWGLVPAGDPPQAPPPTPPVAVRKPAAPGVVTPPGGGGAAAPRAGLPGTGLTQARLAQIVKQALAEGSVAVSAPYVRESDESIDIDLGWVNRAAAGDRKPLEFAVDLQIRIELIREAFAGEAGWWQPYLAQLDQIVARELELISGHRAGQLQECEREARDVLGRARADRIRLSGKPYAELDPVKKPGQAALHFTTMPDGGSVYLITVVDYEAARELGLHDDPQTWTELPSRQAAVPYGYYYFRARWPDGRSKTTGRIQIQDKQDVVLVPEN